MAEKTEKFSTESGPSPAKSLSYSQLGAISDHSLGSLRNQIKKVMIPLLIKIFQLRLELSQSISLPSRLQPRSKVSPEEISDQLKSLDEDLKLLTMWCESSRNQIAKALCLPEEEQKTASKASMIGALQPSVAKSFSDALSSQGPLLKPRESLSEFLPETPPEKKEKKGWLRQFFS